ncbi:recombinase family protein [Paramagnetospirillum magneticum]|uniref:Site-specific recombinase n=1 Tax=Paramagnetospirillum magneticum (strain ATCC 700264 / AMB-1) TaxID=342108 RepID=Q2VYK7_PARM1|nr:recombinase family protein [Paramagnetospirillum magneticum]BAE53318.1 Site-specific recombinase [Paramagnetospirillum magneticum AMB-1]
MATGKFIAYYRVSTDKQGKSGLGLEAQQAAVRAYLNGGDWDLLAEYTEIESGKRADRPQLAQALKAAKKAGAVLVIAKLDRLARNVAFIANMMEAGVDFVACDNPHANRLTLHILAAVAEDEARRISERTVAALQAAKARGKALGGRRTEGQYEASSATRMAAADLLAANVRPIISSIQASGVTSYAAIADVLNTRGIKTARGGQWHASSVRNVVLRSAQA